MVNLSYFNYLIKKIKNRFYVKHILNNNLGILYSRKISWGNSHIVFFCQEMKLINLSFKVIHSRSSHHCNSVNMLEDNPSFPLCRPWVFGFSYNLRKMVNHSSSQFQREGLLYYFLKIKNSKENINNCL